MRKHQRCADAKSPEQAEAHRNVPSLECFSPKRQFMTPAYAMCRSMAEHAEMHKLSLSASVARAARCRAAGRACLIQFCCARRRAPTTNNSLAAIWPPGPSANGRGDRQAFSATVRTRYAGAPAPGQCLSRRSVWTRQFSMPIRPHSERNAPDAQVAQLVEHATENRSVGGSIPPLGTIEINDLANLFVVLCVEAGQFVRQLSSPSAPANRPPITAPDRSPFVRQEHRHRFLRNAAERSAGVAIPKQKSIAVPLPIGLSVRSENWRRVSASQRH